MTGAAMPIAPRAKSPQSGMNIDRRAVFNILYSIGTAAAASMLASAFRGRDISGRFA